MNSAKHPVVFRNPLVIALLIVGFGATLFVAFGSPALVELLAGKERAFELLGATFFLVGAVLCFWRAWAYRGVRKRFLIIWGILCLLFWGEETSWMQHLVGFDTPSVVEAQNKQGEFNLHNLYVINGKSWSKALRSGDFHYGVLFGAPNLFRLCFFTYFLILPLVLRRLGRDILVNRIGYPPPSRALVMVILAVLGASFVAAFFVDELQRAHLSETREMLYAVFIVVYIATGLIPENLGRRHFRAAKT